MSLQFSHVCINCGKSYPADKFIYTCPACNNLLMVERNEDFVRDSLGACEKLRNYLDELRYSPARQHYPNDSGVWQWREFILPGFPAKDIMSLKEGLTDLFEVPRWLRDKLDLHRLYIKMEGQGPSESFKDRGMAVAISDVLRLQRLHPELGIKGVCCASTGDTSAAAAVYTAYARDRLKCLVLLPENQISDAQLFQAMMHGAQVRAIKPQDGFDGCMRLIKEFSDRHPEFTLVNSKNDMRLVGQETIGLEILQDLRWQPPDWIAIPVGNGGNLTALLNGLLRAKEFGLIDTLPGIIAAQASVSNTLVRWQQSGYTAYEPGSSKPTIATAMNINDPVSFPRIKKLHKQFDIYFFDLDEPSIANTWYTFTAAGANICPQSAVALGAVQQARQQNIIKAKDSVVSISTASSVKFSAAGNDYHKSKNELANPYLTIDGTLADLEESVT